jgi:hypothetical protein
MMSRFPPVLVLAKLTVKIADLPSSAVASLTELTKPMLGSAVVIFSYYFILDQILESVSILDISTAIKIYVL